MRAAGVRKAIFDQGLCPDPNLFVNLCHPSPFYERTNTVSGAAVFRQLFENTRPPTGLVFFDFVRAATNVIPLVVDSGRLIPRDLSVVTTASLEKSRQFTSVSTSFSRLLDSAADLLLSRLQSKNRGDTYRILVEPEIVDRGTIAKPGNFKA